MAKRTGWSHGKRHRCPACKRLHMQGAKGSKCPQCKKEETANG